jgi:hypothetical protein
MTRIYRAIVRRDRPDVIAAIHRTVEGVAVLVDRRHADRRAAPTSEDRASSGTPQSGERLPERRRTDRRRPPPATWDTKGFIIVP